MSLTNTLKLKPLQRTSRCSNVYFYVALGSRMSLALWVRAGGGLVQRVLHFGGNKLSLGEHSSMLHLHHKEGVSTFVPRAAIFIYF